MSRYNFYLRPDSVKRTGVVRPPPGPDHDFRGEMDAIARAFTQPAATDLSVVAQGPARRGPMVDVTMPGPGGGVSGPTLTRGRRRWR